MPLGARHEATPPCRLCFVDASPGEILRQLVKADVAIHRFEVATPPLEDANFDRTVVFVLEHHDEGAIGVVINRPSYEALDEPLDVR